MYQPKHFQQQDTSQLVQVITNNPLGSLIVNDADGLEANPLPFIIRATESGKWVLRGHIARANPLAKNDLLDTSVLVLFQGPQSYISPSYYPSKAKDPKVVPTWNYVAVQARGNIRFITDSNWNLKLLNDLTTQMEADQENPWAISDAPESYIQKMLAAIVGIEIEISSLEGKWKASQNQTAENQQGVIQNLMSLPLNKTTEQTMADTIKQQIEEKKK